MAQAGTVVFRHFGHTVKLGQAQDRDVEFARQSLEASRYLSDLFLTRYKLTAEATEGKGAWELLETVAKKRGFLISGGEPDTERAANIVLDEFRGGKIGRTTLELPECAPENTEIKDAGSEL